MALHGRCCVFQPFDKGPFDKRYDETIAPAIEAADLEPYRVDRDEGAVFLVETLQDEIRTSTICLADISTQNPNVMYELGFAIASYKDVVLICSAEAAAKFPFDVQHRGIIVYSLDSASAFSELKAKITKKLQALLKKQETTQEVSTSSPVKSTQGLETSEIAALALIMANVDSSDDSVSAATIKNDMQKAGYNKLASQLALTQLSRKAFIESVRQADGYDNSWITYRMLEEGENWLLRNTDKLELGSHSRSSSPAASFASFDQRGSDDYAHSTEITDDDIPF